MVIEKEDPIVIEREPEKKKADDEVVIEKITEPVKVPDKKEAKVIQIPDKVQELSAQKYEVYRDEHIVAYLSEQGPLGTVVINFKSAAKDMPEAELSYALLFSKVFSALVFDTAKCQGTNIFFNFKDSQLTIVPRFKDDNLNLHWTPQTVPTDKLKSLKDDLIREMQRELHPTTKTEKKEEVPVQVIEPKRKEIVIEPPSAKSEQIPLDKVHSELSKEEKIRNLLEALYKIP